MLEFISSVWWMIVTLGVLVTFHEYGHFWMARRFNIKVLNFNVGFGKSVWSRQDKHGTTYALSPIPLGGYVKMLDTRDPDVYISEKDMHLTYNSKPIWQRALVMLAGPVFNFILAILVFWMMFVYGKVEIRPTLAEPTNIMLVSGAQDKDQIFSLNGYEIDTWQDVSLELITNGLDRRDIDMSVIRKNGEQHNLILKLSQLPEGIEESEMIDEIGVKAWRVPRPNIVSSVSEGYPAALAGVRVGDQILSVNEELTNDWYDVVAMLNKHISGELKLKILRNNNTLDVTIAQAVQDQTDSSRRIIGIGAPEVDNESIDYYNSLIFNNSYGFFEAIPVAINETWRMISLSVNMMGKIVTGKASLENISGPITIAQVANDSASRGVAWFLGFLGLVSLSLGIINLLPIPLLDGGQLLFLLFEKIKGSPLSEDFQLKGQTVGILFLLSFMSIAFYNDILRLVS
ncbi:MAG: RIP metalloprotease RseP [Marinicellaceae bacterium]